MKKQFEIKLLNIHWIDRFKDNSEDLCAHGNVYVRINDEIISDKNSMIWTVSATALYLYKNIM
jgi:hypothetical protein